MCIPSVPFFDISINTNYNHFYNTLYLHEIQEISYVITVKLQLHRWKVEDVTVEKCCHQAAKLVCSEIKCEFEGEFLKCYMQHLLI